MNNVSIFRFPVQIAIVPGLTMPGARPGCLVKLFSHAWAGKQTSHFSFDGQKLFDFRFLMQFSLKIAQRSPCIV